MEPLIALTSDTTTITDTTKKKQLVLKNMPKAYSLPLSLPILFIYSGIKLKLLQCPLQYAFNVEQCEIIRRCSQLLVIPKCEVKLTCTNSLEHKEGLCSHGIVETVLHPKQIGVASDDIAPRMLIKKEADEELQQNVPNKSTHREQWIQEPTHKAKESAKSLLKTFEKLQESTEKDTFENVQNRLNSEPDTKIFPGDEGTYVTYAYKKSIKHLQMEDVILQQKMELRNLKKLRMRDCNRINDFRSELSKKKQLVEQFQVAIEIMEKRMKLMEEKYEKINDHAAAKVIKLLQDRLSDELGKEFSQEFSEYKFTVDAHEETTTVQQLQDKLVHYIKRLFNDVNQAQSEYNKRKQFEISVQHQDQIDDLESALKVSTMRLKKSEDANKQLLKRRQEWSKKEEELQDQINTLQSKLEMNTVMLKKLEDDNELLSKELRETLQSEDQVITSTKAEQSDDKMETDMPLHQSDVAVAPASFQPGNHEMETDEPMYQNDVLTATMDVITPAEAPKHVGPWGVWNENEIEECAKSNGSVLLICSPMMYHHFIQSHSPQIEMKVVLIDILALNNLITDPATIDSIIPVSLKELNRDIVPTSLHEKHIYSLSFSKVHPKADFKFILDTPGLEFLQNLVYKLTSRGKCDIDKPLIDGPTAVSDSSTSSAVVTNHKHTSKAFIVYQNGGDLCNQVDNFSEILRTHCSVDCDVASYHLHEDITNWNVYIQQCIKCTECVLLVCTEELLERLNGQFHERIEMTRLSGPYILSTALQSLLETTSKILPVILDKQSKKYIPVYLQSTTNYTISFGSLPNAASIAKQDAEKILDMPKYKDFRSLVIKLLGQKEVIKPPVASEPPILTAPGCNYADMEAHMACTSSASQLRYASQIAHTKHSNHRSCTDRGNHTDCTQDSYGQSQPTTIGTHCDGATGYGGNERRDTQSFYTPLGQISLQATVSYNKIGETKKKKLIYVVHRSDGKLWVEKTLRSILIELNTDMMTPNDFISGLTLGESPYEAVSKAHTTIIVFSKLAIQDKQSDEQKWFNFAISKAEHKNPDPSVITIIPVLHGDIPHTSLPATVKDIVPLETNDPQFKSKIQKSIFYNDK